MSSDAMTDIATPATASASSTSSLSSLFSLPTTSGPLSWSSSPRLCDPSTARGPIVLSNWILQHACCVGGYPSSSESSKADTYALNMARTRFNVYVNLMTSDELTRFRSYAHAVTRYSLALSPPLKPEFVTFPIRDGRYAEDENAFIAMIVELVQRMRNGQMIYCHCQQQQQHDHSDCWGGHGRTGTVAAVLLAALLPVTTSVDDVFTIVQTLHATRVYNGAHLSPEIGQQPFVRRMIDLVRSLPPNYVPDPRYALASMPIVSTSTSPSADGDADAVTNSVMLSQPGHIRAGGGSGIIIIDEHGIASTTHATSMYPSTPLRRQVTRDPPLMPHDAPLMDGCTLLNREYLPIQPDVTPTVAASVSESSSSSSTASAPFTFTLLTMNTLAKSLCDSTSFPHSNPLALEWSHRAPGIVQELTGVHRPSQYTPDVICIQECDSIVYDEVMAPMLGGRGYSTSFYKKKMSDENKDGVAMFIRTCRMAVLSHRCIAIPTDKPSNQVLVITQLAPVLACYMHGLGRHQHHIDPVRRLYVCTSHLKAKEGHERLRLLQVHAIMSAIQQFINDVHTSSLSTPSVIDVSATKPVEYTATTDVAMTDADYNGSSASSSSSSANGSSSLNGVELPAGAAIMFAGDFNDTPSSDMYAYLASGSATLHADHASSSSHAATSTAPTTTSPEVIRHPFWLHSLYNRWWDYAVRHASNYTGDLYTTVKRRSILVQRCIDYIFYTPASLRPMYLLSIPPVPAEYLPAVNYPSDHFAISGVFQLH